MHQKINYYGIAFCLGFIIFVFIFGTRPSYQEPPPENLPSYSRMTDFSYTEEDYLDLDDSATLKLGSYTFELNTAANQLPVLINPVKIVRQQENSTQTYSIYISTESRAYYITIEEKHQKTILYSKGECTHREGKRHYWLVSQNMDAKEAYYRSQYSTFTGDFFYDTDSYSFKDWGQTPKYKRFYECWSLEKDGVNWVDEVHDEVYVSAILKSE